MILVGRAQRKADSIWTVWINQVVIVTDADLVTMLASMGDFIGARRVFYYAANTCDYLRISSAFDLPVPAWLSEDRWVNLGRDASRRLFSWNRGPSSRTS